MGNVALKSGYCRSWADQRYARVLAAQLAQRLLDRCKGQQVLKVELTYRRDGYADPHELYRAASEQRHVRRFMDRLSRLLGENLRGRWICKMEFHASGWIHFHMLITGLSFIPQDILEHSWGHGNVWITKATPKSIAYVAKYISKDGAVPPYLLTERARSLKIIRVSSGFWGVRSSNSDVYSKPRHFSLSAYVPIGASLCRGQSRTFVRDARGYFRSIPLPLHSILVHLALHDIHPGCTTAGWMELVPDPRTDGLLDSLNELATSGLGRPQAGQTGGAFHLINRQNPPTGMDPDTGQAVDLLTGELLPYSYIPEPWMVHYFTWLSDCNDEREGLCVAA